MGLRLGVVSDCLFFFYDLAFFLRKFTFGPLGDLNSSLDPGVRARNHGAEVTRLGATDLGAEVPGRAQQAILGGVHVADTSAQQILAPTSAPQILAPSSAPCILAPSINLKSETKLPLPTLLSFPHPPLGFFLSLPRPIS